MDLIFLSIKPQPFLIFLLLFPDLNSGLRTQTVDEAGQDDALGDAGPEDEGPANQLALVHVQVRIVIENAAGNT